MTSMSTSVILTDEEFETIVSKIISSDGSIIIRGTPEEPDLSVATLTGNISEHYHLSDRNRANHFGTQSANTIVQDATHRFVTDEQIATWNAKQNALNYIPENTSMKGKPGGYAPLNNYGIIPSSFLPSNVLQIRVVDNIAERDELVPYEGLRVHVKDASDDPEVGEGWAEYISDGNSWSLISSSGTIEIVLDWENIEGKPSSTPEEIDYVVEAIPEIELHISSTTNIHGATSAATPNTIVQRDGNGQFEVGAPTAANHVARKAEVDASMKKMADSDLDMSDHGINNVGVLNFYDIAEEPALIIDENKTITVSRTMHRLNTTGGADELRTINGGNQNDLLIIRITTQANPVTIKHLVGNILTPDGADIVLNNVRQHVMLIKTSADWRVIATGVGLNRSGEAMRGPLSMGGYRITDLAAPTNANDAARKADVDAITSEKLNVLPENSKTASDPGTDYPVGVSVLAITNGTVDGWPSNNGVVTTFFVSSNRCFQIFSTSANNTTSNGRIYVRSYRNADTGWSNWRRQWDDREMGSGSGLDADMLDGIQAEQFIYGDNARGTVNYAGDLNNITKSGFYYAFTGHSNGPSGANGFLIHHQMPTGNNFAAQTFIDYNNDRFYFRRKIDGAWQGWKKIWNESNDGPGSGLDADTVDGLHGSQIVRNGSAGSNTIVARWLDNAIRFDVDITHDLPVARAMEALSLRNFPYETGTWTPELTFGNSSSGITYSWRKGRYTRIKNVVYWALDMKLSSKGTATGNARISGLPFIPLNIAPDVILPVGYATHITLPSGAEWASALIFWNSAVIVLYGSGNVNTSANLTNAHFADNSDLRIQGFYFIPD